MLFVTLAVCLCVAVAGAAVAIFSPAGDGNAGRVAGITNSPIMGGNKAGETPPTGHVNTVPSTRPTTGQAGTTAPVVAGAGLAKTALRWSPTLKQQMVHWRTGPGEAALSAVTQQMGYAMQAGGVNLYFSMREACVRLASDIQTAQAGPPIPDAAMQRLYAKALTGLSRAAADCRHAITTDPSGDETLDIHLNKAQMSRAQAGFTTASKRIYNATAAIQTLRH
jgi:hypothetical protein